MEADRLKKTDKVEVKIFDEQGNLLADYQGSGFTRDDEAVNAAFADSPVTGNIEDYVFEVKDLSTGVTARYRINAHGNLKLIV